LKGSDSAALKASVEKLNQAWQGVSEMLYKAASEKAKSAGPTGPGEEPESGGAGGSDKKDEGPIIDAEVVDEKK
jgi:molecular chaperone DnaK